MPSAGARLRESMDDPDRNPQKTPFLAILFYVLGFMVALGVLAFIAAWLMRRI